MLLLFVLTRVNTIAQDSRGRVQGTVADSSQAIVVGAKILLTNEKTGITALKESTTNGHYLFDYVDPGTYTISVQHEGFSRFVQRNVIVQVRGDVTVDIALKVGGVADTVTVTEAPPAVEFNTSTMSQTIDGKALHSLPSVARNPFSLRCWTRR
jgi:hypothetical protein